MKPPSRECLLLLAALATGGSSPVWAQRQMEDLDRGVVAIDRDDASVMISWRLLADDDDEIGFHVYRTNAEGESVRLTAEPIRQSTNFIDRPERRRPGTTYAVCAVVDGHELEAARAISSVPGCPYLSIPLQTPDGYAPNDASVGDLDGDGSYEIVLHQVGRSRDNSQAGQTDPPILEAYKLDGTFLWRINLGPNIREGAHYTQFIVYDLDGDGQAEIACKTADGTVDGTGHVLGNARADYRDARGYVLAGPEMLTIFDGRTGAALATADYIPPRGTVSDWGDDYGNRVDRFLACVAYLDGTRPSLVLCRGYYTRTVLVAWNWRAGQLRRVWTFDTDREHATDRDYRGQGNHNLSVADVDGDRRDEIIYGACTIDDDGTGLYTTGLGHGDALHVADIDPSRPGLEVWAIHEKPQHRHAANLRDAATGQLLWSLDLRDPGRGLAIDIDPRHRGYECWTNNSDGLYSCQGRRISAAKPRSCNMAVWWDGDLLREILDGRGGGSRSADRAFIDKWDPVKETTLRLLSGGDFDCATNNGTKATPCLCADILGDWREEVIWRTVDNRQLRIFSTTVGTDHRFTTLMQDPVYRLGVAWQNVGYNQPAHTSFYLGTEMEARPPSHVTMARPTD